MMGILSILKERGLLLATGNRHKLEEFRRILQPMGIRITSPAEQNCQIQVEETAPDFVGNARLKAVAFAKACGRPALADDSGLAVDALGGAPGVKSARFGGEGLDDRDRRLLLLEKLKDVPDRERVARFVCVLALCLDEERVFTYEGRTEGRILSEERGTGGFGYDAVFLDPVSGRTFAELPPEEKDKRSHRARALDKFLEAIGG